MRDKLVALIDRSHARVYRQRESLLRGRPDLVLVDAVDLALAKGESEHHSKWQENDPHAQMGWEQRRRVAAAVAPWLQGVLRDYPAALWECAAEPELLHDVLTRLEPDVQRRLHRGVKRNLVSLSAEELREHFRSDLI